MERVAFLIEETHVRIPCLLNPERFELQRSAGVSRSVSGQLIGADLTDDPVLYTGRGSTEFTLDLLFDVNIPGASFPNNDVRALTAPFWQLSEYRSQHQRYERLPQVRFIWGKAWNIPCVVAAVAERYEHFTQDGIPQRSWLRLNLLRVGEALLPPPELSPVMPELPAVIQPPPADAPATENWEVHEYLGEGANGERLDQLANRYYGDPSLWRLLAVANNIDDPTTLPAGALLQIPPLSVLRGAAR